MRVLIFILLLSLTHTSLAKAYKTPEPLPEFTNTSPAHWFNSLPLQRQDVRGKVILLNVWTYDGPGSQRSLPWLQQIADKFAQQNFMLIGIHTPEFDEESQPENVAIKVKQFNITHPVMMDNDFAYWKALKNRFWPTFYIIDKRGRLRFHHIGEVRAGDRKSTSMEKEIDQLLKEN